ncbi:Polyisoprenyl-teichoic acid--peptidoglycan teichoic acid transferase TagU [Exiguobacterium sp. 8H]|nr:LCP family protein [Exiguobacterium sp. 8H]VXB83761.1 Polyisoprenyl-teichoic acid--peptidoglycan teichoic acid transferase TagU [Exiguobacterium sp. 8H]
MKKKVWLTIISLFVSINIIIVAFVWYKADDLFNEMNSGVDLPLQTIGEVNLKQKEPISILLIGVDARPNDKGRSDTVMLMNLNPKEKKGMLISLPRDLYVNIKPSNTMDKLNHAYAFHGVQGTVATVENFLDITIDQVAVIDMDGFKKATDIFGDIKVDNKFEFTSGKYTFPKGEQYLSGDELLAYVRMRKEDPLGDFGRQERQREVVLAFKEQLDKNISLKSLNQIKNLFGENIVTTLSLSDSINLISNYNDAFKSIEEVSLQ